MDSIPPWRAQATVTLSCLAPKSNAESFRPEREICLTKDDASMPIGRTSKRNSTFEASDSNGWFDSPVMSRDHAQLRYDADEHKVYITDSGSLHGTYLNEHQLAPHATQELKDGDNLRFGISIERGGRLYTPLALEVAIRYGANRNDNQPTIFRVPDDTDVEDVSGDEESSIQHSTRLLQKHNIRPRSPVVSQAAAKQSPSMAIDLTGADMDPSSDVDGDEDVSLPKAPSVVLGDIGRPRLSSHIDLTSENEESGDEAEELLDNVSPQPIDLSGDGLESQPHEPAEAHDDFMQSEEPSIPQTSGTFSAIRPVATSDYEYDGNPAEESSLSTSMLASQNYDGELESVPHSQGVSYSDEEDNGEPMSDDESSEYSDDITGPTHLDTVEADINTQDVVAPAEQNVVAQEHQPAVAPQCLWSSPLPPLVNKEFIPPSEPQGHQRVLPNLPQWNTMPPAGRANCPLPSLSSTLMLGQQSFGTAEALGAKTGKYEYFYAREENKANHCAAPAVLGNTAALASQPAPAAGPHDLSDKQSGISSSPNVEESPQFNPWDTEAPVPNAAEIPGAWSSSGRMFLSSPPADKDSDENVEMAEVVPLNDISAYQYAASKKAVWPEFVPTKERQMTINHVVDPPQARATSPTSDAIEACEAVEPVVAPACKRKAEQMSELMPEEQELDTQAKASAGPVQAQPTPSPSPVFPTGRQADVLKIDDGRVRFETDVTRPVKRLRRMAEVVGIAAIGGAFVMSALIATAPTL